MTSRLNGTLVDRKETTAFLEAGGLTYEVMVPASIMRTLEQHVGPDGKLELITFYYHQMEPSKAVPVLIGFTNEIEREFFERFITVSGIGPKAAVRALNQPFSMTAQAIDDGNADFLRSLPGIGPQRAREIVAKLQGRVGKYALLPDQELSGETAAVASDVATEALEVLLQLQYKRPEAQAMIKSALSRNPKAGSAEEILNEVYKQRAKDGV
jgi:holliday junction DNA helicase RuvA